MLQRSSSSTRVRYFRPSLESLEERNLLSSFAYTGFLSQLTGLIDQNIAQTNALSLTVASDSQAFNAAPSNFGALAKLEVDSARLLQQISQVEQFITDYSTLLLFGKAAGMVTNDYSPFGTHVPVTIEKDGKTIEIRNPKDQTDTEYFDAQDEKYEQDLSTAKNLAGIVQGDMIAALFAFFAGKGVLQPLPNQPSSSSSGVHESVSAAPGSASATGPNLTESVTVTNPTNTPVTARILYSATDGTTGDSGFKSIAAGSSGTVSLAESPCPAGVVGTWTVSVSGLPDQTNTTTFV